MRLIDPSQRINVLWDNDDGTRYTEEMTIRRLLAVMSDDEVETITITCCEECKWACIVHDTDDDNNYFMCGVWSQPTDPNVFCSWGERSADNETD